MKKFSLLMVLLSFAMGLHGLSGSHLVNGSPLNSNGAQYLGQLYCPGSSSQQDRQLTPEEIAYLQQLQKQRSQRPSIKDIVVHKAMNFAGGIGMKVVASVAVSYLLPYAIKKCIGGPSELQFKEGISDEIQDFVKQKLQEAESLKSIYTIDPSRTLLEKAKLSAINEVVSSAVITGVQFAFRGLERGLSLIV